MERKWRAILNWTCYFFNYLRWKLHIVNNPNNINLSKITPGSVPVLLNNFNRLEPLKKLVSWLLTLDTPVSIIILDNKSTFHPLLEYYDSLESNSIQVIRMGFNSGLFGLSHYFEKLKMYEKIVISDCDLVPYPDTPRDTLTQLCTLLDRFPQYNHVGMSLGIRDIPDTYPLKSMVLAWEKRFWPPLAKEVGSIAYEADVDTTFGMWRNTSILSPFARALRTKPPFTLKHVDWYIDPEISNSENNYYMSTCSSCGSWTKEWIRWKNQLS